MASRARGLWLVVAEPRRVGSHCLPRVPSARTQTSLRGPFGQAGLPGERGARRSCLGEEGPDPLPCSEPRWGLQCPQVRASGSAEMGRGSQSVPPATGRPGGTDLFIVFNSIIKLKGLWHFK